MVVIMRVIAFEMWMFCVTCVWFAVYMDLFPMNQTSRALVGLSWSFMTIWYLTVDFKLRVLFIGLEQGARFADKAAKPPEGEKSSPAAARAISSIWNDLMGGRHNASVRRLPPLAMSDNANPAKKASHLGECFC